MWQQQEPWLCLSLPLLTWVASTVLPAGLEAGVGGGGLLYRRERERERGCQPRAIHTDIIMEPYFGFRYIGLSSVCLWGLGRIAGSLNLPPLPRPHEP